MVATSRFASFKVEHGVAFCAHTARFRTPVLPLAYDWVEIVVIRAGTGEITLCDQTRRLPVQPGSVVFLMPGTEFGIDPDGMVTLTRVFLSIDYLATQIRLEHPGLASDLVSAKLVTEQIYPDPSQIVTLPASVLVEVEHCLDELAMMTVTHSILDNMYWAQCLTLHVLAVVMPKLRKDLRKVRPRRQDTARWSGSAFASQIRQLTPELRASVDWIRNHYQSAWTLADIAEQAGMSKSGLSKAFGLQIGRTPLALRDSLRVGAMARLLVEEKATVLEAARRVGWESAKQASAAFVTATGVTPGQWRQRHDGDDPVDASDRLLDGSGISQYRA